MNTNENVLKPVFVAGLPGSATSTMVGCLRGICGIQGYNEGVFLSYLQQYLDLCDNICSKYTEFDREFLAVANINKELLKHKIAVSIKESYQSIYNISNGVYYVDKTLDNQLFNIHWLKPLWGENGYKVFFMIRRSLEYVRFRIAKNPLVSVKQATDEWYRFMSDWHLIKNNNLSQDTDTVLELDAYDLYHNSDIVAQKIMDFLPELDSSVVKKPRIMRFLHETRYQSHYEPGDILSLQNTGWSTEDMEYHQEKCTDLLKTYNYTLDKGYKINAE